MGGVYTGIGCVKKMLKSTHKQKGYDMQVTTEHEKEIIKFIPDAEREATKKMEGKTETAETRKCKHGNYNHCFWTQYFHEAMNRMTKEAGLRICK